MAVLAAHPPRYPTEARIRYDFPLFSIVSHKISSLLLHLLARYDTIEGQIAYHSFCPPSLPGVGSAGWGFLLHFREEFDKILKILTKHDITSRNYILKLCPDRVHTIIPGMMVVKEIMDRLNCKELWVSRYGVREGYLCKNFLMTGSTQEVTK